MVYRPAFSIHSEKAILNKRVAVCTAFNIAGMKSHTGVEKGRDSARRDEPQHGDCSEWDAGTTHVEEEGERLGRAGMEGVSSNECVVTDKKSGVIRVGNFVEKAVGVGKQGAFGVHGDEGG